MADLAGPPAIINCEPRQARKGATVVVTLCAGVWLARAVTLLFSLFLSHFLSGFLPGRCAYVLMLLWFVL